MKKHDKLRLLRFAHGYKQEWMAQSVGIIQSEWCKFESGKPIPDALQPIIIKVFTENTTTPP